ncbi:NADH dehydrogenase [ubiquinone] 1 alpha subcomplex subunit 12-like, partial [Anneissia japonica]|uniref:NADH dehydrogenase [ubiquinone] 1 alpha subcomplex subunit 12-like n=1 Tax=Anneissia japonica TaxID=1529436 RepID=UPI001425A662
VLQKFKLLLKFNPSYGNKFYHLSYDDKIIVIASVFYNRGEDLRIGTLVGEDQFGNKYYESDRYFIGRHRWVSYTRNRFWDYDSSQIPPEWHRWIHCMTDDPPSKVPLQPPRFRMEHTENLSGSSRSYVPYSTTPKKIHEWVPPSKS